MENNWNKKRIEALLNGDEKTREELICDFGPVIYTWIYYQIGADEQLTTEWTVRTFDQAIRNISNFNAAEQTLFGYLKQHARHTRDEGLAQQQMKAQRPWAWSQLPDDILYGLSRLRSESLQEKIIDNPYVHEMIQATLVELEQKDRELLIHRYSHLDSIEQISEEMSCPVEDVQDRLYRCRHSFRRVFFQIVSKANSGFAESNIAGEIDTLDMNLEKILSSTLPCLKLDEMKTDCIRQNIRQAIEERESAPSDHSTKKYYFVAVAAMIALMLLVGLYIATRKQAAEPSVPQTPKETVAVTETRPKEPDADKTQKSATDIEEEKLKMVFALGQERNLEALLEILKSGDFTSQAAAAYFIGKLGDPSAIPLLEQAEAKWYPEPSDDNRFAQAIAEILVRFPEAVPVVIPAEPEPNNVPSEKILPPATPLALTGTVNDSSTQPIPNAKMQLVANTLFSKNKNGRQIASAQTDTAGKYQFSETFEGAAFLACEIPSQEKASITRSLWKKKDTACNVNFGGRPLLTGAVFVDGDALLKQTLYLSDTLDIASASLEQETQTDSEGRFSFSGVPAGLYHLLNKGLDNQVRRLSMIEMPDREMYNADFNLETVSLTVTSESSEPNQIVPVEAVLVFDMDTPDNLAQTQGTVAEDGSVLFNRVIPGAYVLKIRVDDNIWIYQNVDVTDGPSEQVVQLSPLQPETALLTGRFLNASPVNLFLSSTNHQIHIDILPKADGTYELLDIPADVYSLATFVKGQLFEFMQVDLQFEPEMQLDIDPDEMVRSFSPLYVVPTDESGLILSGAQVWLSQGSEIITGASTGRGTFLAAPAGNYTLSAVYPGYPTQNLEVTLEPASLLAEPDADNTILVKMGD